jgi:hypothetical protein
MKKDVIYIDIEDDITSIIGKVKDATAKIVALVPPKRIGVLQSAVNLKLLQKSAGETDKRIVLITNDHSLTALAAGLKVPVAKNLQSRPEIPQLEAPEVADEEVINGEDLPIGELAAAAGKEAEVAKPAAAFSAADGISSQVDLRTLNNKPTAGAGVAKAAKAPGNKDKKSLIKVPNFNKFRKKFFLIGGGAIALIILLWWMFGVAPHATVTISAKTTPVSIDQTLTLDPGLQSSSASDLKFKAASQQIKKSVSTDFTATGTKDVGSKAGGTVSITNSFDSDSKTVPAGTTFTSANGKAFASTASVTIPGATVSGGSIHAGSAQVSIQAADIGSDYNIAAQSYSISGYDSLSASGSVMSGGDKQTVTVVSQADVDKAKTQLAQQDTNAVKTQLKKQFSSDYIVVDESFSYDQAKPSVSPGVDDQAKQAKLTVETTYTFIGLARKDVNDLLNSALKSALGTKPNQSIFSNGNNTIAFNNFQKFDNGAYSVRLSTTGYIGSKIDTDTLAKQVAGKRYGEIQAIVNQIPNVNNVDIKFSPFWVSSAPGDPKKVDIKFSISNDGK